MASSVAIYAFTPGRARLIPPCPFHAATGLYCPGCGALRAVHWLVHGEFRAAFRSNILAVFAIPIPLYDIVFRSAAAALGRDARPLGISPFGGWAILAIIVLYWIFRNVPVYPFTLLAPH
ncbi:MAG: DUF2752 domain-containing protein [Armatimonadota bacterium]|nr:DUF2752 domain-containing protein [Armatimonadota bacterium]